MIYPPVMTNIAIEAMDIEIVDLLIKNGESFHSYVTLPEASWPTLANYPPSRSISIVRYLCWLTILL